MMESPKHTNIQQAISEKIIAIGIKLTQILDEYQDSVEAVGDIFEKLEKIKTNNVVDILKINSLNIEEFIAPIISTFKTLENKAKIDQKASSDFKLFKDFNDLGKLLIDFKEEYKELDMQLQQKVDQQAQLLNAQNIQTLYSLLDSLNAATEIDKDISIHTEKQRFLIEDNLTKLLTQITQPQQSTEEQLDSKNNIEKSLKLILKIKRPGVVSRKRSVI